jgi:hypothetical protein
MKTLINLVFSMMIFPWYLTVHKNRLLITHLKFLFRLMAFLQGTKQYTDVEELRIENSIAMDVTSADVCLKVTKNNSFR